MDISKPRLFAIDSEFESMGIAVRNIGAPLSERFTPIMKANFGHGSVCHLHIHSALSHAAAAHAGKVRLTADLEWKAAVHQVIPGIPFADAAGVHGTDEIANSFNGADKNLHRSRTLHGRQHKVRELVCHRFGELLEFGAA